MEDTDIRFHSGIPVGHKFFAILLALAVAGAGCAWLLYRSSRRAGAALSVDSALAQQFDPGIASAPHPAVALADSMLSGPALATLARQAHLASSTPAGQIGEFRSDLELTEPSPQRLDVRFQAADPSESMAVANAVAHALAAWTPASAATTPAPAQSAVPPATGSQPSEQGQSQPAAAPAAAQSAPPGPTPPAHPLSDALTKLGAQLSATDQELDGIAGMGAEPPSYNESRQQSLLRTAVHQAQGSLAGLHRRYADELADPNIGARVNEIRQAVGSILSGGHRYGFNAVGVSARQLSAERSELRQAIRIVSRETKGVQAEEAAHPAANPQPAQPSAPTAPVARSAPPSAPASASPSALQEQNISASGAVSQSQPHPAQNPWSIVRLAAPASRPPLWPALVAGALCGLLYLGIAALAYRRGSGDEIYPDLRSAPQRMITPDDPLTLDDEPASLPARDAPRQRAAFVYQPAPPEEPAADKR